jgi:ABC-type sugar transport system substrate-binding protein
VVTCNTDNSGSKRNCFVGFENELSGRVAAEILVKLCGEAGKLVVCIGFKYILAHMHRLKGFTDKIQESFPEVSIARIIETEENDNVALEKALSVMNEVPDILGFYIAGYGAPGVVNALNIRNPEKRIRVLCHDHTPEHDKYVEAGVIDALICQDPVKHGYEAMKLLSEMVINNKESKNRIYLTNPEIKFKENLYTGGHNRKMYNSAD